MSTHAKWEYLVKRFYTKYEENKDGKTVAIEPDDQFEAELPQLGAEGWELAALLRSSFSETSALFKRQQLTAGLLVSGLEVNNEFKGGTGSYGPGFIGLGGHINPESDPVASDLGVTKLP